jgi:hypothetical protein
MALTNSKVILNTAGYGTAGFTFAILGPLNETTEGYPRREQGENPVFTTDYAEAAFVPAVTYILTIYHPVYAPDEVAVRAEFATDGTLIVQPGDAPIPEPRPGTDLPISLTDPGEGDILTTQTDADGNIQVVNRKLSDLLPNANADIELIVYRILAQSGLIKPELGSWTGNEQPDVDL